MKLPFKKQSRHAQQTLEYSIILALVAAGIILTGPYVIRSWNANLKSAEDSVIDSFNDPLLEDPDPGIVLPGGCWCGDFTPDGCGGSFGAITCEIDERAWIKICHPDPTCGEELGYDMINCLADNTCCSPWVDTDYCGSYANAQFPDLPSGCPDGYRAQSRVCGDSASPITQYHCGDEDPACYIRCTTSGVPPVGSGVRCKDAVTVPLNRHVDPTDEDLGLCEKIGSLSCADEDYTYLEYDDTQNNLGCTATKCEILCCEDWCAVND